MTTFIVRSVGSYLNNTEKQLFESIQYNAFRFFWEEANPKKRSHSG